MGTSVFWIIVIAVFAVAEAATTALISVWFVVGGVAALFTGFLTDSFGTQLLVFALVSGAALAVMVPTLAKRRAQQRAPVTNGAGLALGKHGVVLKAVAPGGEGRVRVDGLDWKAAANAPLPEGAKVVVVAAQGATLWVAQAEPEPAAAPAPGSR